MLSGIKRVILSDLHLGSHRNDVWDLQSWLQGAEASHLTHTEIVLLGDTLDQIKGRPLTVADKKLIDAVERFANITILPGNHDLDLTEHRNLFPKRAVFWDDESYVFDDCWLEHGHNFDKTWRPISVLADRIYDKLLWYDRKKFQWIKQLAKRRCVKSFRRHAEEILKTHESIKYVVTGHLHQQFYEPIGKRGFLVSCGDFVEHQQFVVQMEDTGLMMFDLEVRA